MKALFAMVVLLMTTSIASATCGSQFSGRMFDRTAVKQRVASEDRGKATHQRSNMENARQRATQRN